VSVTDLADACSRSTARTMPTNGFQWRPKTNLGVPGVESKFENVSFD
jgi:hypothetical protein